LKKIYYLLIIIQMKLRSGKNIKPQRLPSSIRKAKASLADQLVISAKKPCAPLHEFKVIVPDFDAVTTGLVRPPPPPQDLLVSPLSQTSNRELWTPPPPPPQDVWMSQLSQTSNRDLWTPPPPQYPSYGGINISADVIDHVCGALQRYTRPRHPEVIHVRSWKKYSEKSSPYILPEQVMRKWLRHVTISGMSWNIAIGQIPRPQQNTARKIMLELHADHYRFN
jgi:hypothetical protein